MINAYVLYELGKERHNAYLREVESHRRAGLAKREDTVQGDPMVCGSVRSLRLLASALERFIRRHRESPTGIPTGN
jgi:hypothetical protein